MGWALFAVMIPVLVFNSIEDVTARVELVVFVAFLGLSALVMSFGNWVDRRTAMTVDTRGVDFENGLRKVRMVWGEIERVEVHQDRLGKRVHLFGGEKYFGFRVLAEVVMGAKVRGQVGFERGEAILETILNQTGLKRGPAEEGGSVVYYMRE